MSLREEFLEGGGCPVIDMHGHMGPFRSIYLPEADPKAMVAGMDRAGIEAIVLSPHSALFGDTREGNAEMFETVQAYPGKIYGYCTVHPGYPDEIQGELDRYLHKAGVVGVKIHPASHAYPVDGPNYAPLMERLDAERGLLLSHTWGNEGTCGALQMRNIAENYPNIRLLLGHCCYGAWAEGIALAKEFPNVYLELTAAAHVYGLIEWMCREAGSQKVVYGTDYPWFDPAVYIGFVTFAHIEESAMQNILYNNARRLLDEQLANRQ
ncbi:MAG: amidohydrolase family protein [Candidatus Hydrogenedentes bacterium]|nr:amidohydrolase family protein [Candidatus Hydrogenedentota bacterium]